MSSHDFWHNRDASKAMKAGKILLIIAGFLLLAFLLGYWIMFLWNETMAAIFGLPTISYWQAVGLFLLAKMFFGIGGRGRRSNSKYRRRHIKHQADETEDVTEVTASATFKEFWLGGGKEANEAYLAAREDRQDNRPAE